MLRFEKALLRRGTFALNVDLELAKGDRLALIGPSGGGKSSVLDAVAGFLPLGEGRLEINGQDMNDAQPATRPVTFLFQEHNLFPHLTVAQNVGLGIRPNLRLSAEDHQRVTKALAEVDLSDHPHKLPRELSGGQRQRVALARALLRDKPLLLLDEPFAALGPALRREMLDLVARICEETTATLIMVTHQPEDAARIAGLTSVVADGSVSQPLLTEELFKNPPPTLKAYL